MTKQHCDICGTEIQGVITTGPSEHLLIPCRHKAPLSVRQAAAEPLVPDGGRPIHELATDGGLVPGVTPHGDRVHLVDFETDSLLALGRRAEGDTDATDKLLCGRVGNYEETDPPLDGSEWCDACLDRFIGYRLGLSDEPELVADGGRATCPDREQTRRHLLYILVLVLWNTLLTAAVVGGLLT